MKISYETLLSHRGFTLIEMLLVIGIIAVLIGAGIGGYTGAIRAAQRAQGNELVHDVQVALVQLLQKKGAWTPSILAEGASGNGQMKEGVMAELVKNNVLSGTIEEKVNEDGTKTVRMTGLDKFGILSPWAAAVVKQRINSSSLGEQTKIPSGGQLSDHRLRFSVDDDYDGICKVSVSQRGGESAEVRASACVWCCGYDGKFGTKDDIYSWAKAQEK